ncbi:hypothetical protein [uncultured Flavobacterium sp.]|uniref:hypothetical protein n=1 Tax=uncultured Flavobacterium sp. TaxID=165435 RepID=UPI0025F61035|nr:hypothetical protein [uncultured Flavobacterium sp.]
MVRITLCCMALLFAISMPAQDIVKCEGGTSFWIIKGKGKKFAVQLRGDIAGSGLPELINIDESSLHYKILSKSEYIKKGAGKSDAALLTRFIKGEEAFLGEKMKPGYQLKKLPSGKTFLLWHHDWFGSDEAVEQQVHATIIIDQEIIWLSCPKFVGQERSKVEALISAAIAKIKRIKDIKELCSK